MKMYSPLLIEYGWFNIASQDEKVSLASIHPKVYMLTLGAF